jgi:hypothetical protein
VQRRRLQLYADHPSTLSTNTIMRLAARCAVAVCLTGRELFFRLLKNHQPNGKRRRLSSHQAAEPDFSALPATTIR